MRMTATPNQLMQLRTPKAFASKSIRELGRWPLHCFAFFNENTSIAVHARLRQRRLILLTRALPLTRPLGLPIHVAASQLAPFSLDGKKARNRARFISRYTRRDYYFMKTHSLQATLASPAVAVLVRRKTIISLIAISLVVFSACARGDVYTTGVALNFASDQGNISAWTQPNLGGDGAIVSIAIDNNLVLSPTAYSVGIGHVWYSVTQGTAIDSAFASTEPAFVNAFTGDLSGRVQLALGQTFLLGFWLDANGNGNPGSGDRFGWARLTYNSSGLSLVNSAIESTGTGIIAGTTTVVPEPSIFSLFLFALIPILYIGLRRVLDAPLNRPS